MAPPKGFIPWNKGTKGLCQPNSGSFKKGQVGTWVDRKHTEESKRLISINRKGKLLGNSHWNWKGNKYSENYRERRRFARELQKLVFERDNYTCQLCGNGGNLQVDHIQSWADYVELRFNIDNCRTLCAKCHYKITFGKPMPPTVRVWGHNLSKGGINL